MDVSPTPGWVSGQATTTTKEPDYTNGQETYDEESNPVLSNSSPDFPSDNYDVAAVPSSNRTKAHRLYRCFKFITSMTALLLLIAQIVSVVYLPFDFVELVLKIFLSGFSVLIILNELEWWSMLQNSPLLTNWITRGVSANVFDGISSSF